MIIQERLNILAVALNIAFSKILLNITGWVILSTEVFPLLSGIALFFVLKKRTLPFLWALVAHSFINYEALVNIEYLFDVPMIREKISISITFLITILFLLIFTLSLIKTFKTRDLKFISLLILFLGIDILNGFCGPYSTNVIITKFFFKLFGM